jgi:hypothetical protein
LHGVGSGDEPGASPFGLVLAERSGRPLGQFNKGRLSFWTDRGGDVQEPSGTTDDRHQPYGTEKWRTPLRGPTSVSEIAMKIVTVAAAISGLVLASVGPVEAKGCIKGAIVGGIAGHMAGHGVMGAAGGCTVGR